MSPATADSVYALPETRSYPIATRDQARDQLRRVAAHGSPADVRRVAAAVHARYPDLAQGA